MVRIPAVSGEITENFMLAAGFIQSTLWRGLANVSIVQSTVEYSTLRCTAEGEKREEQNTGIDNIDDNVGLKHSHSALMYIAALCNRTN